MCIILRPKSQIVIEHHQNKNKNSATYRRLIHTFLGTSLGRVANLADARLDSRYLTATTYGFTLKDRIAIFRTPLTLNRILPGFLRAPEELETWCIKPQCNVPREVFLNSIQTKILHTPLTLEHQYSTPSI